MNDNRPTIGLHLPKFEDELLKALMLLQHTIIVGTSRLLIRNATSKRVFRFALKVKGEMNIFLRRARESVMADLSRNRASGDEMSQWLEYLGRRARSGEGRASGFNPSLDQVLREIL